MKYSALCLGRFILAWVLAVRQLSGLKPMQRAERIASFPSSPLVWSCQYALESTHSTPSTPLQTQHPQLLAAESALCPSPSRGSDQKPLYPDPAAPPSSLRGPQVRMNLHGVSAIESLQSIEEEATPPTEEVRQNRATRRCRAHPCAHPCFHSRSFHYSERVLAHMDSTYLWSRQKPQWHVLLTEPFVLWSGYSSDDLPQCPQRASRAFDFVNAMSARPPGCPCFSPCLFCPHLRAAFARDGALLDGSLGVVAAPWCDGSATAPRHALAVVPVVCPGCLLRADHWLRIARWLHTRTDTSTRTLCAGEGHEDGGGRGCRRCRKRWGISVWGCCWRGRWVPGSQLRMFN